MTSIYEITVTREDQWWMIRIPSLDGVNGNIEGLAQARRLTDVEAEALDYICTVADVAPSEVKMDVHVWVGDTDITAQEAVIAAARAEAEAASARVASVSKHVARELVDAGVPLRDVGTALGVSYQRAHQLVS